MRMRRIAHGRDGEPVEEQVHGRRWAFTLVEVMVVVMIIGLLVAVSLPKFVKVRQAAKQAQADADLEILFAAVEQLAWDTGKWPGGVAREIDGNAETWDLSTAVAGLLDTDGSFANWAGPYIDEVPLDPWGSLYFFDPDYRIDGADRAVVGSFGPNRRGRNVYDSDNLYKILK